MVKVKGTHKMPDGSEMTGKVHSKSSKPVSKGKKKKGGSNPWLDHLKKVFAEGKKSNKDYKYKDAMKDAKKSYKK